MLERLLKQDQRVKRALLAAAIACLAAAGAEAAPSCKSLSVTALAFGNYNVYSAVPLDSAGTISYSCPPPTTPTVTIDAGLAFGNGTRRMTLAAGGDWLAYEIFVDAARSIVWSSTPVSVPAGNAATVPFYARAFASQDVSVGSYSDTLTVTFNF
ncbi:MAG TPA: spore coat U domain-containing protein [Myxococcales bacterium]|nr:spore coat U domain-containing protein [Myxococcales bacterium]